MTRNLSGRLTTGGVIVFIGLILLLSTTGVIAMASIWGWIAALFVLIGLWGLIRSGFRNLVGPVMIIAVAGAILLRNLGVIAEGVLGTWWPLFVILLGLLIVVNRSRRRQRIRLEGIDSGGEVSIVSIFGSDDRVLRTDRFTGAEVLAVFGDADLDLTRTSIGSRPAVVEVISVFGDAELRVPAGWDVQVEAISIFGESIDRRPRRTEAETAADSEEPDLVVTGVALFGEIQIRD